MITTGIKVDLLIFALLELSNDTEYSEATISLDNPDGWQWDSSEGVGKCLYDKGF